VVYFLTRNVRFPTGFKAGLGIVALLRCLFQERLLPFWVCSTFCTEITLGTRNQECSTSSHTPAQGPWWSTFFTFLITFGTSDGNNIQQRSDGRQEEHSAQRSLTIGETRRETLVTSNLSSDSFMRSGATMRRVPLPTLTGLRTLRRREAPTQAFLRY